MSTKLRGPAQLHRGVWNRPAQWCLGVLVNLHARHDHADWLDLHPSHLLPGRHPGDLPGRGKIDGREFPSIGFIPSESKSFG